MLPKLGLVEEDEGAAFPSAFCDLSRVASSEIQQAYATLLKNASLKNIIAPFRELWRLLKHFLKPFCQADLRSLLIHSLQFLLPLGHCR